MNHKRVHEGRILQNVGQQVGVLDRTSFPRFRTSVVAVEPSVRPYAEKARSRLQQEGVAPGILPNMRSRAAAGLVVSLGQHSWNGHLVGRRPMNRQQRKRAHRAPSASPFCHHGRPRSPRRRPPRPDPRRSRSRRSPDVRCESSRCLAITPGQPSFLEISSASTLPFPVLRAACQGNARHSQPADLSPLRRGLGGVAASRRLIARSNRCTGVRSSSTSST